MRKSSTEIITSTFSNPSMCSSWSSLSVCVHPALSLILALSLSMMHSLLVLLLLFLKNVFIPVSFCWYKGTPAFCQLLTIIIILGVSTLLTFSFILRNYIMVSDDTITVCFGFTTSTIPIDSVTSMKKTTSCIASSSASIKRIEVAYNYKNCGRVIFISPKEEDAFISQVRIHNSNIKI